MLTRRIYSAIINFGGMGRKDIIPEQKLWLIPVLDNESEDLPITSKQQAIKLLKELIA